MAKQSDLNYAQVLQKRMNPAPEAWTLADAIRFLLAREIGRLEQEIAAETQTEGGVG